MLWQAHSVGIFCWVRRGGRERGEEDVSFQCLCNLAPSALSFKTPQATHVNSFPKLHCACSDSKFFQNTYKFLISFILLSNIHDIRNQIRVAHDRVKICCRPLRDWDAGHTGDNVEGCDSGVAVKREGSQIPLPINTMQEPVHLKAVSNDFVNFSKNPQKLNEARPAEE